MRAQRFRHAYEGRKNVYRRYKEGRYEWALIHYKKNRRRIYGIRWKLHGNTLCKFKCRKYTIAHTTSKTKALRVAVTSLWCQTLSLQGAAELCQICSFSLEWPPLASLVAKAQEPRGCLKRLSDTVRHVFNIANVTNPEDEGVIDHLVSVTTAMRSPFIAVACHSVSNWAQVLVYSSLPTTVSIKRCHRWSV